MAERLEPRVLYSADALGALAPLLDIAATDDELADERAALLTRTALDARLDTRIDAERFAGHDGGRAGVERGGGPDDGIADDAPAASAGAVVSDDGAGHLVFIDAAVPDAAVLSAALSEAGASVVAIGAEEDGLLVISRTLAAHESLAAVHIVSHGEAGSLSLGTATLDEASLAANGTGIARWGEALSADGDLLLYGCDAGAGEIGGRFVNALATLTGADVAASDDPTGHTALGGDWTLEVTSGAIESGGIDVAFEAERWRHLLDEITITFEGDGLNVPAGSTIADLKTLQAGGQAITLREAVRAAGVDADEDTIVLGEGDWTLSLSGDGEEASASGDLDVLDTLTVRGAGSEDTTITMAASDRERLFDIAAGGALTIEGLTLSGGEANYGGAIAVLPGGSLTARDVVIDGNEATNEDGGGIHNDGTTSLENVVLSGNVAASHGGGLYSAQDAQLAKMQSVRVIGNTASNEGGGGIESEESFVATDLVMRDNTAAKNGGALHAHGEVTIVGGSFTGNETTGGRGGAMEVRGALRLSDVQLSDNRASEGGGALYLQDGGVLERVTISNNRSGEDGGGIAHRGQSASLSLTSVTFTNNVSDEGGGALYARGDTEIVNSTFVGNRDEERAGAIYEQGPNEVRVRNSVFQGNLSDGEESSVNGRIVSDGFNVFSDDPGGSAVDADTDLVDEDALLLPLADNGGPVRTHAPAVGSPLVNAGGGAAPATDATGQPVDAVPDIGAHESRVAADVVWLVDEGGKLLRAPSDFSSVQVLLDELEAPESLVADIEGERLYWLEKGGRSLATAALDGSGYRTLDFGGEPATSLALDTVSIAPGTAEGYLLIAHGGGAPRIDRVPLAELTTPTVTVVSSGIHAPRAIEVRGSGEAGDPVRVYWAEQGGGGVTRAIRSATADTGADVTAHVDGSSGVDGFGTGNFIDLAIDAGAEDFYWTDAARGRIVGFSSSDGTAVVRDPASGEPRSIALLEAQERVVYSSDLPNLVNGVDEDLSNDFSASGVDDEIRGLATARTTPSSVAVANTAPTAIGLEVEPVAENAPGATIGRLTASDPDAGDTATYAAPGSAGGGTTRALRGSRSSARNCGWRAGSRWTSRRRRASRSRCSRRTRAERG